MEKRGSNIIFKSPSKEFSSCTSVSGTSVSGTSETQKYQTGTSVSLTSSLMSLMVIGVVQSEHCLNCVSGFVQVNGKEVCLQGTQEKMYPVNISFPQFTSQLY